MWPFLFVLLRFVYVLHYFILFLVVVILDTYMVACIYILYHQMKRGFT